MLRDPSALMLLGLPYQVIAATTWAEAAARVRVASSNPMRQISTLALRDGEAMTESTAILIYLADLHPQPRLAAPWRERFPDG